MSENSKNLVRELGLPEALAIGLGTMIRTGIFVLSALSAWDTGAATGISHVLAGLFVLLSALNVFELSTGMPAAGGSYHLNSRALFTSSRFRMLLRVFMVWLRFVLIPECSRWNGGPLKTFANSRGCG